MRDDDADNALDEFIAACEGRVKETAVLSPRMRVLTSLIRFADRAKTFLAAVAAQESGVRMLATILEFREMARREQAWIDALLADEIFPQDQTDALHLYKVHLAQVEETAMLSLAYVDSDREEEGMWWARRGGELIMRTIAVGPELMRLPEDRADEPESEPETAQG